MKKRYVVDFSMHLRYIFFICSRELLLFFCSRELQGIVFPKKQLLYLDIFSDIYLFIAFQCKTLYFLLKWNNSIIYCDYCDLLELYSFFK